MPPLLLIHTNFITAFQNFLSNHVEEILIFFYIFFPSFVYTKNHITTQEEIILLSKKILYYDPKDINALSRFRRDFLDHIQQKCKKNQPLILICVGTDRATGDCLGPIIGQSLINSKIYSVYGTLQNPVHAKNLNLTLNHIHTIYKNPFIIAIDSCLGCRKHVGYITLSSMPLLPGQGVLKRLPPIGDLSITGIVDIFSDSDHETIQTTRLKIVFELASFIACGIETPTFQASYPHL